MSMTLARFAAAFEQLCINYCNEKLQGLFNHTVFALEQETYREEGLDIDKIDAPDNEACVHLVERRDKYGFSGILPRLDDVCARGEDVGKKDGKPRDEVYGESLVRWFKPGKARDKLLSKTFANGRHKEKTINMYKNAGSYFIAPKFGGSSFKIKHFAGPVEYHVEGFVEKNKDKLHNHLSDLMASSGCEWLSSLFLGADAGRGSGVDSGRKKKKKSSRSKNTISSKFMSQLGKLMKDLGRTTPHYIRCIKPNDEKLKCHEVSGGIEGACVSPTNGVVRMFML